MKKSFAVNFNGTIRYFDEDAYALMNSYLDSIRKTFERNGGEEIAADIESRIAEILDEDHGPGSIVTIADVRTIVTRMGQPEELAEVDADTQAETQSAPSGAVPPPYTGQCQAQTGRKLYRDTDDVVLGGVLSGLAHYMNVNVLVMRIAFVLLAMCIPGGVCIVAYFIAWILIPGAVTPAQRLAMLGKAVNINSIGRTLVDASNPLNRQNLGQSVRRVLSVGFKCLLGFVGFGCFVAAIILIINAIWGLLGYVNPGTLVDFVDGDRVVIENFVTKSPVLFFWSMLMGACALIIPAIAAMWVALSTLFKTPSASKTTIMALLIIECVIIAACIVIYIIGGAQALVAL